MNTDSTPNSPQDPLSREAQFELFFTSNYRDFYHLGLSISKQKELTQDTLQSFFLEMWEKKIWTKEIEHPKTYFQRAFYRKMMTALKAQAKGPQSLEESKPILPEISFEEALIESETQMERAQVLAQALDRLSPTQREMIQAKFQDGKKYEELAREKGKSKQTIYNQVHTAIQKLREILGSPP
ncbi:MAG: sigma-70 family RNA polymerase sigma factor [Bacteroidota bacterium]